MEHRKRREIADGKSKHFATTMPRSLRRLREFLGCLFEPQRGKNAEQPSRNQGGVRPSSGAATSETLSPSRLSAAVRTSCDAAPEDGRTPGLSENPHSLRASRLLQCRGGLALSFSASLASLRFISAGQTWFLAPLLCVFRGCNRLRKKTGFCVGIAESWGVERSQSSPGQCPKTTCGERRHSKRGFSSRSGVAAALSNWLMVFG